MRIRLRNKFQKVFEVSCLYLFKIIQKWKILKRTNYYLPTNKHDQNVYLIQEFDIKA